MSENEKLIENSISKFGLRTLHYIKFGSQVDARVGMGLIPGEAIDLVRIHRSVEEPLGIHHLFYTWQAREMIEFQNQPVRYAVLWWIAKGENMSWSIELASCLYKVLMGRYPKTVWVNRTPKSAPETYMIRGIEKKQLVMNSPVQLKEAFWVPERFVCAGIELKEFDPVFDVGTGKYKVQNGRMADAASVQSTRPSIPTNVEVPSGE